MNREPDRRPRPRKRFGQHFLVDGNIVGKIIRAAGVRPGEHVLEIGPGRGALTGPLLDAGALVTAVEVDRDLAAGLERRFSGADGFELVCADALDFDFLDLARRKGQRLKVVANLPYNISGPMTARLLDQREAFSLMVLMYQKEVAARLTAAPGTRDYGSLSVIAQVYTDVKKEFDVPPGCFRPPPKVSSTVVSMRVLDGPRVPVPDPAFFARVVRSAFGQRRKTLANALGALGLGKPAVAAALAECSIDPARRGETLTLAEFSALASALMGLTGRT